jgi:zinc protease
MKWFILLSLLGSVACSQMSKQGAKVGGENEALNSLSFDVHKEVLPNGLTVLLVENKKLPIFTYYTFYKVGGKFETQGITGASHFLEHMMFKGAKKYGYGVFDQLVEGNGGRNNAYTSNDLTVYYQDLPSEHVYTMIDLEADRMENLLLKPEAFESERLVVLEERKMRYENSDRGKLYLNMMQEMFVNTPYGTSVIGNIEDLKSVSRDQIYDYFKKYYAPNNAVIVIVGDINSKKVMKEIKAKFGSIAASEKLDEIKAQTLKASGFNFQGKYNRSVHP